MGALLLFGLVAVVFVIVSGSKDVWKGPKR